MDKEFLKMIEELIESNARMLESRRDRSPEDLALIQKLSETAQQVTDAVARLESQNPK